MLSLKQPSLLQVVTYVKIQQNKPSARLTDQLHKYITLSAKIRQIESKWFDFLSHATIVGKSTIQCTCHRVSSLYLKIYLQTLSFHVNRYYRSAVTCLFWVHISQWSYMCMWSCWVFLYWKQRTKEYVKHS